MAFVCVTVLCLAATACGKEADVTSIAINKDGKVKSVMCAEFTEPNYNVDELSDMATTEISAYNSDYLSTKITMDSLKYKEEDNSVKMIMTYNNAYDYASFNHVILFYGTVSDAISKGYTLTADMKNADGEKVADDWTEQFGDKHIVICEEKTRIRTPYAIDYATDGITYIGKKEADLSGSDKVVQLLLSK